ncbi:MAG TPA: universal stress protein [Pyrinomonadaceae bacterium]|nr:universal stress protein [Pyrinomonadaceae bacterium]
MKILIGHDGSQSADAALVDLQRAGLPVEAEAQVVSVADIMMVPQTPAYELAGEALMSRRVTSGLAYAQRHTERVLNEAKDFARRASDQVRSFFPHWSVRAATLTGSPAWELISKADEWKPDLIVVGSHGRSAVSRFILGSVSKKVVTDSDHSVRVSRGDLERDLNEPVKLVIGVDASAEAEQAVRGVGGRVWPYGTEVQIIAVDDGSSSMFTSTAGRMVAWAENALSLIGLKTSVRWEKGDPSRVLIDQAQAWDADSIFVGGRRFSGALERFQLGSVATALVTKAHCSVEVVRNRAT